MVASDLKPLLDSINARLKTATIPVRVRLNRDYLVLRATLPKKPSEGEGRKQYDLSLGIPANKHGLKRIEAEAQKLGSLISLGAFTWEPYLKPEEIAPPEEEKKPVSQWIQEFKDDYMGSHKLKEATWRESWQRTFDRLPQAEPLNEASILAVVMMTQPHTRGRELACQRLQKLADFGDVKINLKTYQGDYNERTTEPRDVPSDNLILKWRELVPSNHGWQWVYGMLAAFGIRPHEAFFCEFLDIHTVKVTKGKTGPRITRAIHPEWAEQWALDKIHRPQVHGKTYRDYGQQVSRRFSGYEMPFVPYDLRHAFAIRGSVVKRLPVSVMASMMGHSVAVHTRIYHRWLSDSTNEQVYRSLILGEGQDTF
jgi:integrase